MGTLAFFYFVIILFIILNGFNDTNGHGRCGCRHKRLPRECRSKKPMQGNIINNTKQRYDTFPFCDFPYGDRADLVKDFE